MKSTSAAFLTSLALLLSLSHCQSAITANNVENPTDNVIKFWSVTSHLPDKADVLFMIDNSQSMFDKQALLAKAVPELVNRLVNPLCLSDTTRTIQVDASGNSVASVDGGYSAGYYPEFPRVSDMHIGIITSSLGAHGGEICNDGGSTTGYDYPWNQMAHLVHQTQLGVNIPTYNNQGFLNWDPNQVAYPRGEKDSKVLYHARDNVAVFLAHDSEV
jgi:hypothetical protein